MKILFFSDTHLDKTHEEKTKAVEAFIRGTCANADMVFLLGDIFEFYHGHGEYLYPWFRPVTDAIRDITAKGVTVYFVEGNHEFTMGLHFESYTGAIPVGGMSLTVDGKKVFVSHGDEFGASALRTFLKSSLARIAMDVLGARLTWVIAMGARVFLSKKKKTFRPKIRDKFREHAAMKLAEGFDAVVLAHTHMPDKVEYPSGEREKVYLNTGDFLANSTYVSYETGSGFTIRKVGE